MHKHLLVIFVVGIIQLSCNQHVEVEFSDLRQIYGDILKADSFRGKRYLIDSIENFQKKSISQSGTTYFIAHFDSIAMGVWTEQIFDNLVIIPANKLRQMSKRDPFTMTPTHYTFSLPYFNKDKNSFLIYYDFYCGNLCAEYSLRLYKKINGKWIYIKSYFSIVS